MAKCTVIMGQFRTYCVHFIIESSSPVATDEVTERVNSAGDLEKDELSSIKSLLCSSLSFEDSEEDESGSAGDLEEDEPEDPRVQEEVCSRNDGISNSIEICNFLKLV